MATFSSLRPRDTEIFQLASSGRSNIAMGEEIYLSEKTVEFHLDHIDTRIGMQPRPMTGMWAMQKGIGSDLR